jgi:hypothetical protein
MALYRAKRYSDTQLGRRDREEVMGRNLRRSGLVLLMWIPAIPLAAQPAAPIPSPVAPAASSPAASAAPAAPAPANGPEGRTPPPSGVAAAAPPPGPADTGPGSSASTAPPARVTLADPVLTCKTLSELLLWENKETDGAVLRRTVAEQSCRNLPGGTAVSVAETATIKGTAYHCLNVEGESECVWAGAVGR